MILFCLNSITVVSSLSAVLFESIVAIGQHGSSKNWTIQFKSTSAFKKSLSEKVLIGENTYSILDADSLNRQPKTREEKVFKMTVFFRIHWLPLGYNKDTVYEFLKEEASFLEVLEIANEKWQSSEVYNGVLRVKAEYNVLDHSKFLDLACLRKIENCSALIQISGMPHKCLFCGKFGHVRSGCSKTKLKCTKCKKNRT